MFGGPQSSALQEGRGLPPFGGGAFGYLLSQTVTASPRRLMLMTLPAGIFWVAYFSWLDLRVAAVVAALGLARQAVGAIASDKVMQVISLLTLLGLAMIASGQGGVMLLPVAAASWKTAAAWLRNHRLAFRTALIAAELCALVFGSLVGAQLLVMASLGLIFLNLTAIRLVLGSSLDLSQTTSPSMT